MMRITTYATRMNKDNLTVLVKEKAVNYSECESLNSPKKITKMMCDVFKLHLCAEEYVYLLALNSKCRLLGVFEVAHGTVDGCMLNTRELMMRNLLCGASSFVVVHNHPSGVLELSRNDVETTKQICSASELMGITMLDHIVIARAEEGREEYAYFSMKDHGLMQK